MSATSTTFEWKCTDGSTDLELDDDFVCHYKTLMLRAERMSIDSKHNESWWWAVYTNTGEAVELNQDDDSEPTSGAMARACAEKLALQYLQRNS